MFDFYAHYEKRIIWFEIFHTLFSFWVEIGLIPYLAVISIYLYLKLNLNKRNIQELKIMQPISLFNCNCRKMNEINEGQIT